MSKINQAIKDWSEKAASNDEVWQRLKQQSTKTAPLPPTMPRGEAELYRRIAKLEKDLMDELLTGYHDADEADREIISRNFHDFRVLMGWEPAEQARDQIGDLKKKEMKKED